MKRGEIWLVALDPTVGSEIQKTRPCVIVSPNEFNTTLRRIIVAPLTSRSHPAAFRIATTFRRTSGLILLDQIRTVDRKRVIKRVGTIEAATLVSVLTVLSEMFAA